MGAIRSVLGQLGLARIMVCGALRVERFYFDSASLAPAVVRAELLHGMEQVGDTWLPEVSVHMRLAAAVCSLITLGGATGYVGERLMLLQPRYLRRPSSSWPTRAGPPGSLMLSNKGYSRRKQVGQPVELCKCSLDLAEASERPSENEAGYRHNNAEQDRRQSHKALLHLDEPRIAVEASVVLHAETVPGPAAVKESKWLPNIVLAVGPEGGWCSPELELLAAAGFSSVTLGSRPLRTDVALVALISCIHEYLDSWH
eukprot:SM000007S20857  [mRNA]  locus=s7:664288:666059:+ [translate_table: standard]